MSTVNFRTLRRSLRYAAKGLAYVFRHEQSFRIQILATIVVLLLLILFRVERGDLVLLLLLIGLVLILEILNSAVEVIIDLLRPRVHFYAEIVKDMMAAAVFLASLVALVVGFFIFFPYLLNVVPR